MRQGASEPHSSVQGGMSAQGWPRRETAPLGSSEGALAPALVERPAVGGWLEREVQALLLEEDVSLVSAHLLGTVRALTRAPVRGGRTPPGRQAAQLGAQPLTRQQVGCENTNLGPPCMSPVSRHSEADPSKFALWGVHSGWRRWAARRARTCLRVQNPLRRSSGTSSRLDCR